jgi:lysine-N-methylase
VSRPRLSPRIRARRHLVGDRSRLVLHRPDGEVLAVGDREWAVLAAMDGTRDLEGIRAAAAAAGAAVSHAHLEAFVAQLRALGVVEDGAAEAPTQAPPTALPRDLPVRALPRYRFRCDGSGSCCRLFGTVLFTPLEAARARAAVPEVLDGGHHEGRVFTPERGLDDTLRAVAMRDGACAYLAADGRCRIHAAAGARHKPFGCRTFPARFVDTGREIRVTPRPECACVFDEAGDEPLTTATHGAALPPETFVPRVPDAVRMGPHTVDGPRFVAWCDAVELPPEGTDLAGWLEALADAVERHGSAAAAPGDAPASDSRRVRGRGAPSSVPTPDGERAASVDPLLAVADRLAAQHADWRAEHDLVRRATDWVRAALRELRDERPRARAADRPSPNGAGAVAAGERDGPPLAPDEAAERLYVRALFFGAWPSDARSVEDDLRERALHLRIARAFPAAARRDPAGRAPLALVEALARGHGLTRG